MPNPKLTLAPVELVETADADLRADAVAFTKFLARAQRSVDELLSRAGDDELRLELDAWYEMLFDSLSGRAPERRRRWDRGRETKLTPALAKTLAIAAALQANDIHTGNADCGDAAMMACAFGRWLEERQRDHGVSLLQASQWNYSYLKRTGRLPERLNHVLADAELNRG